MVAALREQADPPAAASEPATHPSDVASDDPASIRVGSGLSEREYEIAMLIGLGASNREIARQSHITEGTAKNHISNRLRKLGLRDRTQLAVWILRHSADQ
nr:LuxR C-terminal-related transcriptional regulator [Nonomuraea sediminis]